MTTTTAHPAGPDLWIGMVHDQLAPNLRQSRWDTPGQMAKALDRTTVQTPALDLIDEHLVKVADGEIERLIISMPPQEGKSERTSRRFPEWLLQRNPNLRIAIVSFGQEVARRWGGKIRDDLRKNPQLGLTLSASTAAKHEFELLGYEGGVFCTGIEGGLTSRPVDILIIDDPYKNAGDADSKAWARTVRDFWTEVALPRLAPGAPVVLIQTRWREDDLAGWLAKEGDDWVVLNIPAQAVDPWSLPESDREYGQPDPLGREPGEFMESARRRSVRDWLKKIREVGSRTWNALYQGRPAPAQGTIFKREWWQYYDQPLWIVREDGSHVVTGFDTILQSWDMTFKDTEGSDYVCGAVWARRGADAYLLDLVYGKMDFPETQRRLKALSAKWPQAVLKLVEDKANGSAIISSLSRTVPGIVPEEPAGSKEARAVAVSPLVESRNCWLPDPELAPWVGGFVDEHAGFPTAAHDDQVDTTSQALNRLVLQPLIAGEIVTGEDLDDELDDFGSYVP